MKNNIQLFFLVGALASLAVAEVVVPPATGPIPDVAAPLLTVLLNQLAVVRLVVTVRAMHFSPRAAASEALALLDKVDNNIALLRGDRGYTEAAWFLSQIATAVGNVGVDLEQNNDITITIKQLRLRVGESLPHETRVPLPTSFCWILMREIYQDLANALSLIPTLDSILQNGPTSTHE
jgi:hypothetical protein